MSQKIEAGQTGAEVREILNKKIEQIDTVSTDVANTVPLTNSELSDILK